MKEFFPRKYTGTYNLFNRKTLLFMRLTVILILLGTMFVKASGYAQKVNISVKDASIEGVFKEIKKQTGFYFLYDAEILKNAGKVTLTSKDLELTEILKQLTAGTGLNYKIIDKTVIISDVKSNLGKIDITIKGKVTSKEGIAQTPQPLPGAIVTIKGTKRAVIAAADGTYTIEAPADGVLVFSILGFSNKEVNVDGRKTIDVTLLESASDLQEVIVTAYGTKERKENQVGSAFQLTSEDLKMRPLNRIDQLMEGVVPGLQYTVQDATASSARPRYQTRIRGESSFGASNEPLWVVDGIKINTGNENNAILGANTSISPLSFINPNDIESVTILKDATATSIYGADGANGVMLITTKRGRKGKPSIGYGFRTGINLLNNSRFHMLSASEYRELLAESDANSNINVDPASDKGGSTDWYDVFFRNGITTQHDLTLSGGSDKTNYYISAAYFNEKPIMINNKTDRFSTRVNIDQKVGKKINLRFYGGASYNINDLFTPGNSYYINKPIDSPYNPDGSLVLAFYNQLANAKYNDDTQKTVAATGGIGGDIEIIPGLKYTTTNGIDYTKINEKRYGSIYTFSDRAAGQAKTANTNNFFWNTQHRLNYEKQINKHEFSALLGGEAEQKLRKTKHRDGSGFVNDDIRDVEQAFTIKDDYSEDDQTALSYYGQVRYGYDKRYNLVASYRADANSNFGSDVRWATFSSIGASWTISNEKFWKIKQIDFAKLKLSYGTNGNSRIGVYKSKGIYSLTSSEFYNGQQGAIMSFGENPVLSWETTYLLNGGLNIGLFKRISLEIEGYRNITKNLLNEVDVSRTNGFTTILQNVGKVKNTGIEFTLNTQNILSKDFEWTSSLNFAHNHNEIMELYNGEDKRLDLTIRSVGEDVNANYLIRWAGVDPRDGAALWYDTKGNITREFDLNNRVIVGSPTPDFFGGMKNTFRFKNIYLSALLIYNVGGYAFSSLQRDAESDGRNLLDDNQSRNQLERWREAGDLALAPKTILGENANTGRNSTRFLHSKTSLRLTNINVSYNLSDQFLQKIRLKRSSIYLQADNVGFWTPYHTKEGYNDYKNSFNPYPQPLVISFGLNVGL